MIDNIDQYSSNHFKLYVWSWFRAYFAKKIFRDTQLFKHYMCDKATPSFLLRSINILVLYNYIMGGKSRR